jgi:hypothetical protein
MDKAILVSNRPDSFKNLVVIDGRPGFAKRSIDDGRKVEIAAIDPDFD